MHCKAFYVSDDAIFLFFIVIFIFSIIADFSKLVKITLVVITALEIVYLSNSPCFKIYGQNIAK